MENLAALPNSPISKPNTQRGHERCRLLLDVATELFIQHGYEHVSLDQIVEVAGGSKATIYKYFGNKQGLFFAIFQQRCNLFLQKVEQIYEQNIDDIQLTLENLLYDLYQFFIDSKGGAFERLLVQMSENDVKLAQEFYETGPRKAHQLLAALLQKAHDAKQIHCPEPEISAIYFYGFLHDVHWRNLVGLSNALSDAQIRHQINYVVERFVSGHAIN
ncbi:MULTISPECIES: TetR/AcrR family transcriptional regulator [unclassified Acinetobacter]|uniref:TetR/AcrR family transcriptional regulator n=1 Tax=unclassified Acinetobacter TaxID=196816 RepID=UPI0035BB1193